MARTAVLGLLLVFSQSGVSAEYEDVDVPFVKSAQSLQFVRKAIKLTLVDRHWDLDHETDTAIQATLNRPHESVSVTVRIAFDTSKASIVYVDSKAPEKGYRDGGELTSIRLSTYRNWVNNLAKDIPANLQRVHILLN